MLAFTLESTPPAKTTSPMPNLSTALLTILTKTFSSSCCAMKAVCSLGICQLMSWSIENCLIGEYLAFICVPLTIKKFFILLSSKSKGYE
jgi:hypothetical protein